MNELTANSVFSVVCVFMVIVALGWLQILFVDQRRSRVALWLAVISAALAILAFFYFQTAAWLYWSMGLYAASRVIGFFSFSNSAMEYEMRIAKAFEQLGLKDEYIRTILTPYSYKRFKQEREDYFEDFT